MVFCCRNLIFLSSIYFYTHINGFFLTIFLHIYAHVSNGSSWWVLQYTLVLLKKHHHLQYRYIMKFEQVYKIEL